MCHGKNTEEAMTYHPARVLSLGLRLKQHAVKNSIDCGRKY